MLRWIAPASASLRADLLSAIPERVAGDLAPAVPLPAPTLSQHREMTIDVAMRLAAGWVLFQVVLGLGGGRAALHRFGKAVAINAAVMSLFSLVQLLCWNGKIYGLRPSPYHSSGPFVSHNHLAAYLNVGLGFAFGLLLAPGRDDPWWPPRTSRLWGALAAGLIIVGIISSESRGGFLAMLIGAAVTFMVLRPRSRGIWAGATITLALVAVFLVALGTSSPYKRLATLLERTPYLGERNVSAYSGRMEIWTDALRAWPEYPVWGLGLGSFATAANRYFRHDIGEFFAHAENEYVEILVEGGVIGLGCVLLALVTIARLGSRGLKFAPDPGERALIMGGLFGGVTLAVQCLGDFPLHIPAIGVSALILVAHIVRVGLDAPEHAFLSRQSPTLARTALVGPALAAVGLVLLSHGFDRARAVAALDGSGLQPPGYEMPTSSLWHVPMPQMERIRVHLERSLRNRPDWAEGHVRLGVIQLSQYASAAAGLIEKKLDDPARRAVLSDPLWLHGVVHKAGRDRLASVGGVLVHEPIRRYLVPAARSFLEARRCCPVWGLTHAELAGLDFLLVGDGSASVYARRALRLSGPDSSTIMLAARAAAQAGDLDLAARCWRKALEVLPTSCPAVADVSGSVLAPDQILKQVVPDGRSTLWFAERLYGAPEQRAARDQFLETAVRRLPQDQNLSEADRLRLEAVAWFKLDNRYRARDRMEAALALEPRMLAWRKEFIERLLEWGKVEEAHTQALIGFHHSPKDPEARHLLERTAEALARGPASPTQGP
jgi:O-antigen ligase